MNINGLNFLSNHNIVFQKQHRSNALLNMLRDANVKKINQSHMGYRSVHYKSQRLSFFNGNRDQTQKLLDAVNFSSGVVSADPDGSGYFEFGEDCLGQMIPTSAIKKINIQSLEKLYATNNKIQLKSNSYYSYKGIDGNSYVCAFNGSMISRAFSESILKNDMKNVSAECRGNTVSTMSILSDLAKGEVGGLITGSMEKIRLETVFLYSGKIIQLMRMVI